MGCFVRWEVDGFGGEEEVEEEVDDDEEEDEELDEDEEDEEDVVEEVSNSESLSIESLVGFCFEDGNTVGARTDRPGISNVALDGLLRFR